ncbi:SixA phosphatase family protein [Microbacterium sp.]|uniref:SixA phosphatase family protein n=1 Tax=Microbacterium sp. TaxID=51671 RepID=UPI0039E59601
MKTLLLARHAKSDWGAPALADHDRPLNPRGRENAPAMARRLRDEGVVLDLIVSSTALRARSTASAYAAAFGLDLAEEPLLYAASAHAILQIASMLPDESGTAMLVGHNPGMSDAVHELTGSFVEMPTCAVAECTLDAHSWAELVDGAGSLVSVRTPRDGG